MMKDFLAIFEKYGYTILVDDLRPSRFECINLEVNEIVFCNYIVYRDVVSAVSFSLNDKEAVAYVKEKLKNTFTTAYNEVYDTFTYGHSYEGFKTLTFFNHDYSKGEIEFLLKRVTGK